MSIPMFLLCVYCGKKQLHLTHHQLPEGKPLSIQTALLIDDDRTLHQVGRTNVRTADSSDFGIFAEL